MQPAWVNFFLCWESGCIKFIVIHQSPLENVLKVKVSLRQIPCMDTLVYTFWTGLLHVFKYCRAFQLERRGHCLQPCLLLLCCSDSQRCSVSNLLSLVSARSCCIKHPNTQLPTHMHVLVWPCIHACRIWVVLWIVHLCVCVVCCFKSLLWWKTALMKDPPWWKLSLCSSK